MKQQGGQQEVQAEVVRQTIVHILNRLERVLWVRVGLGQAWHTSRRKARTDSSQRLAG